MTRYPLLARSQLKALGVLIGLSLPETIPIRITATPVWSTAEQTQYFLVDMEGATYVLGECTLTSMGQGHPFFQVRVYLLPYSLQPNRPVVMGNMISCLLYVARELEKLSRA